jgi:hypothetical protein
MTFQRTAADYLCNATPSTDAEYGPRRPNGIEERLAQKHAPRQPATKPSARYITNYGN